MRIRTLRAGGLVLLLGLWPLAGTVGAAAGGERRVGRCAVPPSATIVVINRHVVVFRVPVRPAGDEPHVVTASCLRSRGRTVPLAVTYPGPLVGPQALAHVRVAGRFVAYVLDIRTHYGDGLLKVQVTDLRAARRTADITAGVLRPNAGTLSVADLELTERGFAAWHVASRPDRYALAHGVAADALYPPSDTVVARDAAGAHTIATAAAGTISALTRAGTVVTWRVAGQPRSYTLRTT